MDQAPIVFGKRREFALAMAGLMTKGLVALCVVIAFAAIQWIRYRHIADYPVLLVGAVLSAASLAAYGLGTLAQGRGQRSWTVAVSGLSGLVPYLFGGYLVFYRGLWSLRQLRGGFSALLLAKAAAFVVLGYFIVLAIYKVTDFARAVDEGRIVLVDY